MAGWFINDAGLSRARKTWLGHGPNIIDLSKVDVSASGHLVPEKGHVSVGDTGISAISSRVMWLIVALYHVAVLAAGAGLWAAFKAICLAG